MADHRATHRLTHDETHLRDDRTDLTGMDVTDDTRTDTGERLIHYQDMHHYQCAPGTPTATDHSGEIIPVGQPGGRRQHR